MTSQDGEIPNARDLEGQFTPGSFVQDDDGKMELKVIRARKEVEHYHRATISRFTVHCYDERLSQAVCLVTYPYKNAAVILRMFGSRARLGTAAIHMLDVLRVRRLPFLACEDFYSLQALSEALAAPLKPVDMPPVFGDVANNVAFLVRHNVYFPLLTPSKIAVCPQDKSGAYLSYLEPPLATLRPYHARLIDVGFFRQGQRLGWGCDGPFDTDLIYFGGSGYLGAARRGGLVSRIWV